MLISILVSILLLCIILGIAYWIITLLPFPQQLLPVVLG